jgi:hypothetical protein
MLISWGNPGVGWVRKIHRRNTAPTLSCGFISTPWLILRAQHRARSIHTKAEVGTLGILQESRQ